MVDFADLPWTELSSFEDRSPQSVHRLATLQLDHGERGTQLALEAYEHHGDDPAKRGRRRFDFSTVVHLLLNITEEELWEISCRDPQ